MRYSNWETEKEGETQRQREKEKDKDREREIQRGDRKTERYTKTEGKN